MSVRSSKGGGGGFTNSPNVLSPCGSHLWAHLLILRFVLILDKAVLSCSRKQRITVRSAKEEEESPIFFSLARREEERNRQFFHFRRGGGRVADFYAADQ